MELSRWGTTLVGLVLGAGLGLGARSLYGMPEERAGAIARQAVLAASQRYESARPVAVRRFRTLAEAPPGRPVYGVSVQAVRAGAAAGGPCWGVVLDARTGEVYRLVGGNVPWLECG